MFLDSGKLRFTATKKAGALTRHAVAAALSEAIMKQTEQTYIKAGYTVARAIRAKNAARARAAIQNFDFLLALEAEADRAEARRLYVLGYNEGQH